MITTFSLAQGCFLFIHHIAALVRIEVLYLIGTKQGSIPFAIFDIISSFSLTLVDMVMSLRYCNLLLLQRLGLFVCLGRFHNDLTGESPSNH